jgi:uncharacterized protein (TIGR02391 family)
VSNLLGDFERIVRGSPAPQLRDAAEFADEQQHPFESRNIHPDIPARARELFDDGYLPEAVLTAFKFVDVEVKRMSRLKGTGVSLMGAAFGGDSPVIALNPGVTDSDRDEQRGYRDLFAGAMAGIRNPRGHEIYLPDTPDEALDYLGLASLLLRKLDGVGRQPV